MKSIRKREIWIIFVKTTYSYFIVKILFDFYQK